MTNLKNAETLESTTGTKIQPGTELIKKHHVDGTPFWIVGNDEEGYRIAYGQYAITDKFPHIEDGLELIEKKPWTMLLTVVAIISEDVCKMNTLNNHYNQNQ